MAIRRAAHAVYDLKYHVVWIPKDRKSILTDEVAAYAKEVFHRVAEQYEMEIDRVEVVEDHVPMVIYAPPR
jgi:putative transposase